MRRRQAFERLLNNQRLNATDLARLIGLPRANAIYNFLKGRSEALSQDMIERILIALPAVSFEELVGWAPAGQSVRPGPDWTAQVA